LGPAGGPGVATMNVGRRALAPVLAAALALAPGCSSRQRVGASTWPPPCAGSRILEVTNLGSQTYEVVWGDDPIGRATPGVSRLPVESFKIVDAAVVGGPLFRVLGSRAPYAAVADVRYRLLCE
jgi:hypothetical protein